VEEVFREERMPYVSHGFTVQSGETTGRGADPNYTRTHE
jgi:hypothetical protein